MPLRVQPEAGRQPGLRCYEYELERAVEARQQRVEGGYTRITFERRFSPGPQGEAQVPVGDTMLGQQVMALAIGSKGTVEGCEIVATSGDMRPDYGCAEAKAEKFQASAHTGAAATKQAYMTIIVFGHSEHVV